MIRIRLLAAIALVACGGSNDPATPVTPTAIQPGLYVLATVDGKALPFNVIAANGTQTTTVAGNLTILPGNLVARFDSTEGYIPTTPSGTFYKRAVRDTVTLEVSGSNWALFTRDASHTRLDIVVQNGDFITLSVNLPADHSFYYQRH